MTFTMALISPSSFRSSYAAESPWPTMKYQLRKIVSLCSFQTIVGILTAFEYIYNFQSFVMSKLIQWSSVLTPIGGVETDSVVQCSDAY